MKILYVQDESFKALENIGIKNCLYKYFDFDINKNTYTKRVHSHNNFELHLVTSGCQRYETDGKIIEISAGNSLLIPPKVIHRVINCDKGTCKVSITFNYDNQTNMLSLSSVNSCVILPITNETKDCMCYIENESAYKKRLSHALVENRIFEIIVYAFRAVGIKEEETLSSHKSIPTVLIMAEQYIADNIKLSPTVHDVALFCNISEKQLSRIFISYEHTSLFEYIRCKRLEAIQKLLENKTLSLKEISEEMNFANEYYFNVFFKKAYGMPPGTYRKMF